MELLEEEFLLSTWVRAELCSTTVTKSSSTFAVYVLAPFLLLHPYIALGAFLVVHFFHTLVEIVDNASPFMEPFQTLRTMRTIASIALFYLLSYVDITPTIYLRAGFDVFFFLQILEVLVFSYFRFGVFREADVELGVFVDGHFAGRMGTQDLGEDSGFFVDMLKTALGAVAMRATGERVQVLFFFTANLALHDYHYSHLSISSIV